MPKGQSLQPFGLNIEEENFQSQNLGLRPRRCED